MASAFGRGTFSTSGLSFATRNLGIMAIVGRAGERMRGARATSSMVTASRRSDRRAMLAAITMVAIAAGLLTACENVGEIDILSVLRLDRPAPTAAPAGEPRATSPPEATRIEPPPRAAPDRPVAGSAPTPSSPRQHGEPGPVVADARIAVGLLVPLTGADAGLGRAMLRGAQLALFDLADEAFVLRPYDTRGTPEGARDAVRRAADDGAMIVLGPLFAASVAAATPVARAARLNLIAFSNDRGVAAPGTFLIGHMMRDQVERVVTYASRRGVRRFAAMVPDGPFGVHVAAALRSTAARLGAGAPRIVRYVPTTKGVDRAVRRLARYDARRAALRKRRAALRVRGNEATLVEIDRLKERDTLGGVDFGALLVPTGGALLTPIAARLPFYDLMSRDVRLLGIASWDGLELRREPAFRGAWFAHARSVTRSGFEARFGDLFGRRPGLLAALAYDATGVATVLSRRPDGADFSVAAITQPSGFAGVSGLFRFRADGIGERRYAISEIAGDGVRVVSEASGSFATPDPEEATESEDPPGS